MATTTLVSSSGPTGYSQFPTLQTLSLSNEDLVSTLKVSIAFQNNPSLLKTAFKEAYDKNDFFQAIAFAHASKLIEQNGAPFKLAEADIDFALFREMLKTAYPNKELTEKEIEQGYSKAFKEGLPAAAMVTLLREHRVAAAQDVLAKIVKEGIIKNGLSAFVQTDDQPEGMFYFGRYCLFDQGGRISETNRNNAFYYMKKSGFCQMVIKEDLEKTKTELTEHKESFREIYGMLATRDGTFYCKDKADFEKNGNDLIEDAPSKKRRSCILV